MKERHLVYLLLVGFVLSAGSVAAFVVSDFFNTKVVQPIQNLAKPGN